MPRESPEDAVRRWVRDFVVALGLCPFAAPVLDRLRVVSTDAVDLPTLAAAFADELERLVETDADALPTTVLVTPKMLADFDDYLDALGLLEASIAHSGLEGVVQLASFHPDYRFDGAPEGDVANFTNRAPYPAFHLLREADITRAVEHHPDIEGVPGRNVDRLRALGRAGLPFWSGAAEE